MSLKSREVFGRKEFDNNILRSEHNANRILLRPRAALFTDGFVNDVVKNLNLPFASNQPANVFINGEYWGLYLLMDQYNDEYFSQYYNVPKSAVAIVKNGISKTGNDNGAEEYKDILEFASTEDLSKRENYLRFCEMVDIDSVIDYFATNLYIMNEDESDGWNVIAWKCDERSSSNRFMDGKWRLVLYDLDRSMSIYNHNSLTEKLDIDHPSIIGHSIMKGCLKNLEFRRKFYNRVMELLDNNFSPENILPLFEEQADKLYDSLVADTLRYNNISREEAMAIVDYELNEKREFLTYRKEYLIKYMNEYFTDEYLNK